MKKVLSLFTVGLAACLLAVVSVNATDLTDQIEASSELGSAITFTQSWDEENEVNNLDVVLLLDTESINAILNHAPGNANSQASLSMFNFQLNPNLAGTLFKKEFKWVGAGLANETIAAAKTSLNAVLDATQNTYDYDEFWPAALNVQYYDEATDTWKASGSYGNGSKTIAQDLIDNLGINGVDELEYGVNFRFAMYDEYAVLIGFEADNDESTREYVLVDWEIKFPVAAQDGTQRVLFADLDAALASGSEEIYINKDLVYDGDLDIPDGVEITVADGVTLELTPGYEITGAGTVVGSVKVYNTVTVTETENGTVSVDKTTAAEGDQVKVTVTPKEGYELEKIVVEDADGKEVEVNATTGVFTMPATAVEVTVTFVEKEETTQPTPGEDENKPSDEGEDSDKNPDTADNIVLYVGLSLISLAAIAVVTKKVKRFN